MTKQKLQNLLKAFKLSTVEEAANALLALKGIGVSVFVEHSLYAPSTMLFFSDCDIVASQEETETNSKVFNNIDEALSSYGWLWGNPKVTWKCGSVYL